VKKLIANIQQNYVETMCGLFIIADAVAAKPCYLPDIGMFAWTAGRFEGPTKDLMWVLGADAQARRLKMGFTKEVTTPDAVGPLVPQPGSGDSCVAMRIDKYYEWKGLFCSTELCFICEHRTDL